jgi:hypothetical protein
MDENKKKKFIHVKNSKSLGQLKCEEKIENLMVDSCEEESEKTPCVYAYY